MWRTEPWNIVCQMENSMKQLGNAKNMCGGGHPGGLHRQQIPTDEFAIFISPMLDF